jgi:hypothetical protein
VNLCLWTVNFTWICPFFSPLLLGGRQVMYFPFLKLSRPDNIRGSYTWLTSFFLGEKNPVSGILQNGFFGPFTSVPTRSKREFFFSFCQWTWSSLGGKSHKIVHPSQHVLVLLEFLALRLVYTEHPSICPLQLRFPYLDTSSCRDSYWGATALVSHDSL